MQFFFWKINVAMVDQDSVEEELVEVPLVTNISFEQFGENLKKFEEEFGFDPIETFSGDGILTSEFQELVDKKVLSPTDIDLFTTVDDTSEDLEIGEEPSMKDLLLFEGTPEELVYCLFRCVQYVDLNCKFNLVPDVEFDLELRID